MMKYLMIAMLTMLSTVVVGAEDDENPGMVFVPAGGKPIVLVDARFKAGFAAQLVAKENDRNYRHGPGFPLVCETSAMPSNAAPYSVAACAAKAKDAGITILIYDGKSTDAGFAIYPEERIAIINATRYGGREIRLVKEIWRSIGYIAGAGFSKYSVDPMQPIWSAEGLDGNPGTRLTDATIMSLDPFLQSVGIRCAEYMPYETACISGFAPAPTSAVQKAIWDEVHALPNKPITIKPEMKKVTR